MIDLDRLNPVTRVSFGEETNDDGTPKEWVEIRVFPADDIQKLMRKYNKTKREFRVIDGVHHVFKYDDMDPKNEDAYNEEIWDYTIVNWCLFDQTGESISCTREMKILLMGRSVPFATCVGNALEAIRKQLKAEKDDIQKNS